MEAKNDGPVGEAIMGSPIFDATFQTGRFEREKNMTTITVNMVAESIYKAMAESVSAGLIEAAAEIDDILTTLKHARVFITSREKMHPTGVELYDELVERLCSRAADRSAK